ncbi:MAG: DUF4352 domain-containing protein [Ktedonobacterales bacterium]|nr:DUF4352 domain-containing protein [Ktedonobacterales bacterium]
MASRTSPLIFIASLAGALLVLLACSETSTVGTVVGGTSSSSTKTTSATATPPSHFKAGQEVQFGDFIVTINGVKTSQGGELDTLKTGHIFVVVDVTLKNTSTKAQLISSFLDFTIQDATGQKYNETIITDATPPDGTVAPGGLLRGQLTYAVPKTQKSFTFSFQPDYLTGDQAIWDLHD